MGLFRVLHNQNEVLFNPKGFDTNDEQEWENVERIEDPEWEKRYDWETQLISQVIDTYGPIKNVLELGSGPGVLSQKLIEKYPDLNYHLVDKKEAKKIFEKNKYKGKFFVKDLSNSFDTKGLLKKYDLVITNDFLEHIFNPHAIVEGIYNLTHSNSVYFISNPNWRMGHQFVYRGLFDFDNLVYFLYCHLFKIETYYHSTHATLKYPRLSSESLLPEERLYDWNHYLVFKHDERDRKKLGDELENRHIKYNL